jgi:hypothetical protein
MADENTLIFFGMFVKGRNRWSRKVAADILGGFSHEKPREQAARADGMDAMAGQVLVF